MFPAYKDVVFDKRPHTSVTRTLIRLIQKYPHRCQEKVIGGQLNNSAANQQSQPATIKSSCLSKELGVRQPATFVQLFFIARG
jgi:hypothetical protein